MKKIAYQFLAAITFFTRIPIWKLADVPVESYRKIICFWPLTGWITGAITACSWIVFSSLFPAFIALILSFTARVLLTGGLHEDGLGDFFDGFGGGKTKEDTLRIMKDSHVGSYALIGLIIYYLLLLNSLFSIKKELIPVVIFVADPLSKFVTALLMNLLPYARKENESKSKTLYDKLTMGRLILTGIFGLVPILFLLNSHLWISIFAPFLTTLVILTLSKRKIGGYTGDICGATALLCELSIYMSIVVISGNFY